MKNVIIVLLVAATAAGAYFFMFRKKTGTGKPENFSKEQLIGKWKTDSRPAGDSSFSLYQYEFAKEGVLLSRIADTVKADTAWYAFTKDNRLEWKKNRSDSAGKVYTVEKLGADTLQLRGTDSLSLLFTRVK